MADIFLSYNRANKQIAQDFVDQIRRRFGYTVWWDQEMSGGENWIQEVNRQQSEAKATIVLWSKKCFSIDTEERGHVKSEVEWALTNKRVVIPLTIPPFDHSQLMTPFNTLNTLRFNQYDLIQGKLAEKRIQPSGEPEPELFESQDIFKTSGQLRHTLIKRDSIEGYRALRSNIRAKGQIVRLYGDTQSGKTQMALYALDEMRPFQLHGKQIKSVDDIYASIAANEPELLGRNRQAVVKYIVDMQRPVMIDDFHWVENEALFPDDPALLQREIIEDFKQLREKDISLLLISIPDCAARWLGDEIGTRTVALEMPKWRDSQLRQIPTRGFHLLRVVLHPSVVDELVAQSHGNPALVQRLCLLLCHAKNIWQSNRSERPLAVTRGELENVFRKVASEIYGDRIKEMVEQGPRYRLEGGDRITLDGLLLKVLDLKGGFQPLTTNRIRKTILDEELVDKAERHKITDDRILTVGKQLIMQLREADLAETTLGIENEKFFIQHPNFKVHLHWKLLPDLKLLGPALTKFADHTRHDIVAVMSPQSPQVPVDGVSPDS
jgi:hypothetical protein